MTKTEKEVREYLAVIGRRGGADQKSEVRGSAPLINKDLPTLYAFQFQNTMLGPRVVLHFLSHFIFIFSIED